MDAQPDTRPPFVSRLTLGRIAIAVAVVGLVYVLYNVILLIFFAALLAAVLRGAADWVAERTGMRVGIALTLITVAVLAAFAGLGYWLGPSLAHQGQDLVQRLTSQFGTLRQRFEGTPVVGSLAQGGSGITPQSVAEHVAKPAVTILSVSLEAFASAVVLLVTTLYFAASPETYVRGVVRLVPIPRRPRVYQVMEELGQVLRMWLLGQLIDMVIVGVLTAVGLWLVGVPVPFALGVLSGLFTFVPYFGTIVAGIVAVMVALSVGLSTALWALGVFTVGHLVEGYVVAPMIQRRFIDLPPALTVLAMTVLGTLFGTLGIVLGTPLAAAGLVTVRMLYVGDVLGDYEAEPPREHPQPQPV